MGPGYSGVRGFMMKIGENMRQKAVNEFISNWDSSINSLAILHSVDPNMVKAVFKEEISHQLPGELFLESYLDIGATVGPGQINVGVWSEKLQLNRDALKDIWINIDATASVLSIEQNRLISEGHQVTPELWGSRYNYGKAKSVTNYGHRVGQFYNEFSSGSNSGGASGGGRLISK